MNEQELRERLKRTEDALGVLSVAASAVLITLRQLRLDDIPIRIEAVGRTTTGHCLQYALDVAKPVNAAMETV